MAIPFRTRSTEGPESRCVKCGHLQSEHGTTGTRPCLAMVGDLLHRRFCSCDEFHAKLHSAA